ncbi:MAG: energy-coupling factor transporter transmembrane component T [Mycoplasma sp.]
MIQISNSTITNKSIFRKINPSFKLVIFIISIFMIFIPSGFFGQLIVLSFILTQLALARLTKWTYLNILKVFITIFALFILINWISVKSPIGVFLEGGSKNFLGIGSWSNFDSLLWDKGSMYGDEPIFISKLFGGEVTGQVSIEHVNHFQLEGNKMVTSWINSLKQDQLEKARSIVMLHTGETSVERVDIWLYLLNNSYEIGGVKFNNIIIQNIPNAWMQGNLLCNPLGGVNYNSAFHSFGPLGIVTALQVSIKVILIIISSSILTSTTTPSELTNGIEKLFSPLKIIRFPANECALILSIGIRFIPSLLMESKRILNAQAARGLDYYNGNFKDKIRALISLIIPLFSISIRKSDELAYAMDARAYNPRASRTRYRRESVSKWDYIYLGIAAFVVSLTAFLQFFNFIFLPFGIIEAALVL